MKMKLSRMTTAVMMKTIVVKSDSRVGFFLRLLLRASLPTMAPCGTSAQPASRQTTCCRLGNKIFGCCVHC